MGNQGGAAMKTVLWIGGIVLLIGMILGGQIIFAGIILVFLLILDVGGLMYREMGPPPTP